MLLSIRFSLFLMVVILSTFLQRALGESSQCYGCQDNHTCCGSTTGCCPLTNAICCSDNIHCCPSGYTCNQASQTCIHSYSKTTIPLVKQDFKTSSDSSVKLHNVCSTGSCSDSETCCDPGDGTYNCCPLSSAVCCSDHQHCCPSGFACDVANNDCINLSDHTTISFNASTKLSLHPPKPTVLVSSQTIATHTHISTFTVTKPHDAKPLDICPIGTCPANETCCTVGSSEYGCCPYPSAICCADQSHCCPQGYACNINERRCVRQTFTVNVKPLLALKRLPAICTCGADYTCCPTPTGGYGCCPFQLASCCPDMINCCPGAYICTSDGCTHPYTKLSFNFTSIKKQ